MRSQCVLCKHNPSKRCQGNFAHKYWVGDRLLAKCEGELCVELVTRGSADALDREVSFEVPSWVLPAGGTGLSDVNDSHERLPKSQKTGSAEIF